LPIYRQWWTRNIGVLTIVAEIDSGRRHPQIISRRSPIRREHSTRGPLMSQQTIRAAMLLVSLACARVACAITVTSNDFASFEAALAAAPNGDTVTFNLGANSTIHFSHQIYLLKDVSFVGNGAVFDGGNATPLFVANGDTSFTGCTFQNSNN